MKAIALLMFSVALTAVGQTPTIPKGYQCTGWSKPEATAIADGDSGGEELVVNTPLTEDEKKRLYYARQREEAAIKEEAAVEEGILANHHLLFRLEAGSDWLRLDSCGGSPMIRSGEYHITQFVPSNPKYPSSAASCRIHYADMRKHAVKAVYGVNADEYDPNSAPASQKH
jgi:hypothetical protein